MPDTKLLAVARGDAPADLLFTNARVVNTFTAEVEQANVAVYAGRIAGVGEYTEAKRVIDLHEQYLAPGFIDGHVHIESSYLHADQYARAVTPHGTLACVTDLHEVTNVAGLPGMRYLMACARRLPMDIFFMAPSCVPATHLETSGAELEAAQLSKALRWKGVLGLGEVMNFPGVINGEPGIMAKLRAAERAVRDGHAPHVRGKALNAYLCPLIGSDHETTQLEEGREKLRRGMYLMVREGSTEKNLEELLPLVTDDTYHRCMLVVDDRNAKDLYHDGDVDAVVRKAIRLGLDPVRGIQMVTLVPATYFRMAGLGAVAPGYWANLQVLSDLKSVEITQVYYRGRLVAQDGEALVSPRLPENTWIRDSLHVKPFAPADLALRWHVGGAFPVIETVPGQIVTRWLQEPVSTADGVVVPDPSRDLLKLAVIERHRTSGNIGLGMVKGFGLQRGAIGSSVAHDSHNIVCVGVTDEDIHAVATEIARNKGGLAVADSGRVVGSLPLPIAGLLSDRPLEEVASRLEELERLAAGLGCEAPSPFSVLSFLALPVIPELKLTDRGLVDVSNMRLLDLAGVGR